MTDRDEFVSASDLARMGYCERQVAFDASHGQRLTVEQLQQRYGGQWVLKGAGSVVLDSTGLTVCGLGNAGMAVGGMGDVLSGLTAGLLAQFPRYPLIEAVTLHAAAGDLAAAQGQRGMTALDVIEQIRAVVSA